MTSSPSPSGCGSSQSSLKDIRTLDDVKDIQPDKQHPTWVTPKERSENAAQLRVLTAALKLDSAFSLHTPDLQVASSSANVVPPSCNTQPERQLQTQQAYNQSPSRKRKYQVTMMADSPLKLRVSWGGAPPCGLDGTVDNPSPWDALAGEDASSSDDEPVADRRAAAPSVQQAGQSAQAATTTPSTNEARFPVLRPGDEIWTVITRPIIPDPDGTMADIFLCLFEAGFHIIGKNHRFDLMFVKPAGKPLPFQSRHWQSLCGLRKTEIGE